MLPLLVQMAGELGDQIHMVKFNCNKDNKQLGKDLGIKVAPTFHLYKNSNKVGALLPVSAPCLRPQSWIIIRSAVPMRRLLSFSASCGRC